MIPDSRHWNFYKCTILAKRVGETSLTPPPPLSGKKLESDREFTVVNTAMPRSPTLNKVKVHTYTLKYFSKVFGL